MDPLSITSACGSLLAAVTKLSTQITKFVSSVRDARRDIDAVSRELTSLALCLETLRDDSATTAFPDNFSGNLLSVLGNCGVVVKDIADLLARLQASVSGGRVQWPISGRNEVNRLRSSLESHKSALEIALDMMTL
jgi:hypothetical protein